jgi:uncharacterized lipoprotein YehR (DUF1307 family)
LSKKVILTITALVLVVTLSGIGVACGPSEPSQFLTYTDEANGFSIDYPQGWYIERPAERPTIKVSIWSKRLGVDRACIMVTKESVSVQSLESYSELRMQHLSDTAKDYVSISTEELTINDISAVKHTYAETVGTTPYETVQVYLVDDGSGWLFGFACPQKSFDSYKSTFDTALNSFRLLK